MRLPLLMLLCMVSMSVSAQFLSFKKHERFPLITQVQDRTVSRFVKATLVKIPKISIKSVRPSEYSLELSEFSVMHTAQHNMRFRVYNTASYNFSDLAQIYVKQNRYSEAKWYLLQSNMLSRQQNNDKLTICNLMSLAGIKAEIGDFMLAQQDLFEARDMAAAHGWLADLIFVERKLKSIQNLRIMSARTELRYASNALDSQRVID